MLTSVALLYFDNNKDLINKSKTENFKRKQYIAGANFADYKLSD